MSKDTIVFLETAPWEKPYLQSRFKAGAIYLPDELDQLKDFKKINQANIISIFVNSQVKEAYLKKLPKLKLIATRSTGFDHIDLKACAKHKVAVTNVPSYGENTVAEHAFALLLALSHRITESNARARDGNWSFEGLIGFDLKGRTLGIIGMGRIGSHAARMAKGFNMKVLAYDLYPNTQLAKEIGFKYCSFNELLKNSDVVTLHTLLTPQTHHLLNTKTIKLMKKGAILINTARGGLVETKALVDALLRGHLAGAGVDVLEEEDLMKNPKLFTRRMTNTQMTEALQSHVLLTLPNVIVTPHNAFNTREAINRILDTTITNIRTWQKGKPVNIINPSPNKSK